MSLSVHQLVKLLPMPTCCKLGVAEEVAHWNSRVGKYLLLIDGPKSLSDVPGLKRSVTCDGPFYRVAAADCLDGSGWICCHGIEIGD